MIRWTAEQEYAVAREARAFEDRARAAIAGLPAAEAVLRARLARVERTRGGSLERIERAIGAVEEQALKDPAVRGAARRAREAWTRAEALRWDLAMSARNVARAEARRLSNSLMGEEDLVQDGYIGLLRASRRFDPDRGLRFVTYARWWVRAQIIRAIETSGRTIRLPGGAVELMRSLREAQVRFERAGVPFTLQDLAEEVGADVERVEQVLNHARVVAGDDTDSEDGEGGEARWVDRDSVGPEDLTVRTRMVERVREALGAELDEREQMIVLDHFGLDGREERTMAEIGDDLGLSRERVRQIEKGALARVRTMLAAG